MARKASKKLSASALALTEKQSRHLLNLEAGATVQSAPAETICVAVGKIAPHVACDYHGMVRELKQRYKINIRKWHTRMSGAAYELTYANGRIKRLIAAPRPRGPVSAAIFLHEVGHHAVGFRRYPQRCLEEYYVWQWAFREMAARRIPMDPRVIRHYKRSMYHYLRRERARGGHHHVPPELHQFACWPN